MQIFFEKKNMFYNIKKICKILAQLKNMYYLCSVIKKQTNPLIKNLSL